MKTAAKTKIFLVEDEMIFQEMLSTFLKEKFGYQLEAFSTGQECLSNLYKNPDIVLLDYNLLDQTGLEILKEIKSVNPDIHVLLISGQKNIPVAVDTLKYGAYDYVTKGDKLFDQVPQKIQEMMRLSEAFEARKRKRVARTMALSAAIALVGSFGIYQWLIA